ncbi:hypothetical protein L1049_021961 [Liquidambar formosana]|uniref:RBR-type E3 ubiquitin transferase n=1 Tax=Liquidambar formosana TaxID=63359 RepID=A0AAP0RBQ3_LIQFO
MAMEGVAPIEVVDVEDDVCFSPIQCRGSNKINPISVEQYTPSSCSGSNKINPISVEQYTEERDLHRAIMASIRPTPTTLIIEDDDDDDVRVVDIKPGIATPFGNRRRKPSVGPSVSETGQCSNSKIEIPPFMCEICVEPKPMDESFKIDGCTHSYCTECVVKYVASKLQDNVTCIRCPVSNCTGLLEPEYCRDILPSEVFERWGNALCESVILGSEKFYCPFKDCSALLINDGGEVVTQSECPNCRRLFCAQCKASWHVGIDCAEFQKLNKDEREREDIMMMNLAKNKNWKRCPKCRFYVEKSQGCMYMKCRCGFAFCYNCGAPSTTNSHLCSKCKH